MKTTSEKIVFFGSGPVAAQSLEQLLPYLNVVQVVTKRNRGREAAPVEQLATIAGIPLLFADRKAEVAELATSGQLEVTRCGIVIDYGVILPTIALDYFELGIVNSHFSLLPELRGADPISFAILEGHEQTGVTLMRIVPALDEGDVITQAAIPLINDDNGTTLTEKLVRLSSDLLIKHLPDYLMGKLLPRPQEGKPTYTRKLEKSDGNVDWSKPALQIEREVRAFIEWPKSTAIVGGQQVLLTGVKAVTPKPAGVGTAYMLSSKPRELFVACGEGSLEIVTLKTPGKAEMSAQAFLNGYRSKLELELI